MLNSGEAVPVRYAVVEADWLIASHHGLSYSRNPQYPAAAQPRDYGAEVELQIAVEGRASNLDPWRLLTDSVLPIDGPPIVRHDGVVLSGNGRTQSIRLAIAHGQYSEVAEGIRERAAHFRLDPERLKAVRHPVLVRIMDEDVTDVLQLARYGMEMNRDPGQGMSSTEQCMGLARILTSEAVRRLADLVAELPEGSTVREFMRRRAKDIAVILSSSGLVDPRKRAAYFTPAGDLTELARELVETALAGLTVTDVSTLRSASRPTREKLMRAGIEFMRMRSAGVEWDLAEFNNEAVRLVTEAENRATASGALQSPSSDDRGSPVERLLYPERFGYAAEELGFKRVTVAADPSVEALALCLEFSSRDYLAAVAEYATCATRAWQSMFGCLRPEAAFAATIVKSVQARKCL